MSAIRVRPAAASDDLAVGELLVDSFVGTYARKMPEVVVTGQRLTDLRDVQGQRAAAAVVVAEAADGRLAGTVTLYRPGSPGTRAWTPNAADLRYMAVARGARPFTAASGSSSGRRAPPTARPSPA
jgi:hypothetical protein